MLQMVKSLPVCTWSLKKVPLSGGASPYRPFKAVPSPPLPPGSSTAHNRKEIYLWVGLKKVSILPLVTCSIFSREQTKKLRTMRYFPISTSQSLNLGQQYRKTILLELNVWTAKKCSQITVMPLCFGVGAGCIVVENSKSLLKCRLMKGIIEFYLRINRTRLAKTRFLFSRNQYIITFRWSQVNLFCNLQNNPSPTLFPPKLFFQCNPYRHIVTYNIVSWHPPETLSGYVNLMRTQSIKKPIPLLTFESEDKILKFNHLI